MASNSSDAICLRDQLLYSGRFDDFYSSRDQPDREKEFVFCQGNQLQERFAESDHFVIGELGFGSGTSFLATMALWQKTAPADARLDFISVERYPLARSLLREYLQRFPQWRDNSEQLLALWPGAIPGFHCLSFANTRIRLTLIVDEVASALHSLEASIDAWFLDGFSPAKNPQMWTPAVIREIARLSHQGTTFATYTAAGQVRRDLIHAGFEVEKSPGYGQKRERLTGRFRVPRERAASRLPKHFRPHEQSARGREVTIIGAGLAGAACANRLAARGYRVTLLEQGERIACGTSSNPAAIMQPFLSRDDCVASRFSRQGYLYTLQRVRQLEQLGINAGFHPGGLFSLPKSEDDLGRKLAVATDQRFPANYLRWQSAVDTDGLPGDLDAEGLFFPAAGWFDIRQLCEALIEEFRASIDIRTDMSVTGLDEIRGGWRLNSNHDAITSPRVVVATGHHLGTLAQCEQLPLLTNYGQLDSGHCDTPPDIAISSKGYVVPSSKTRIFFGSTHEPGDRPRRAPAANTALNLVSLRMLSTALADSIDPTTIETWEGVRATTPDHLPMIGELPRVGAWSRVFGPYLRGRATGTSEQSTCYPGLYCCAGLGSRALTSALLGAEILASVIDDASLPIERAVFEALHPARFLARALT